ncbi:MAG: cobalamin biosynthesis protein CobD [Nitrospira sp.]|nr:cobalamin biosynthesis protein CobD [bacterium]MBL7048690.1 cobalamin biosynthesis protein CobD [Nitrospira sp.]
MTEAMVLTLAYIIDLIIGDPRQLPHPVRLIGLAIEKIEVFLNTSGPAGKAVDPGRQKWSGLALVVIIAGAVFLISLLVTQILMNPHLPAAASYFAGAIFLYLVASTIATRELLSAARGVIQSVSQDNITQARERLSMIVGRDTGKLDKKEILRATIETLAENISDGIVAPMFYFALGGFPLAMAYKAVNTLDSMVGYKNEKYIYYGRASAKLDDFLNYIPARLTGGLIVAAAFVMGSFSNISGRDAFAIMKRDGRNHSSPNSGIPEAAMAGALGIMLGGPSVYGGVVIEKPFIGEDKNNAEDYFTKVSETCLSMTRMTSFIGFLFALGILYGRNLLWR